MLIIYIDVNKLRIFCTKSIIGRIRLNQVFAANSFVCVLVWFTFHSVQLINYKHSTSHDWFIYRIGFVDCIEMLFIELICYFASCTYVRSCLISPSANTAFVIFCYTEWFVEICKARIGGIFQRFASIKTLQVFSTHTQNYFSLIPKNKNSHTHFIRNL